MPNNVLYPVQEELLGKKKRDKMLNLPDDNEQQRRRPKGGGKRKKDKPQGLEAKREVGSLETKRLLKVLNQLKLLLSFKKQLIRRSIVFSMVNMNTMYSIIIPLKTVIRPRYSDTLTNRVKIISAFSKEVIFKAQLFINYYIINNCLTTIPKEIFSQNFLYSVCMLIFGNPSSQGLQVKYSSVPNIGHAFDQYFQDYPLFMRPLSGLKGYSQCLSSAFITLATTYSDYYVETF
ncbi:hypothetical protein BD770DRAFT_407368 [Pilaira anomala]|nr:hypothetical protein BD770DRAFT_407368 [Pilaira anomala]